MSLCWSSPYMPVRALAGPGWARWGAPPWGLRAACEPSQSACHKEAVSQGAPRPGPRASERVQPLDRCPRHLPCGSSSWRDFNKLPPCLGCTGSVSPYYYDNCVTKFRFIFILVLFLCSNLFLVIKYKFFGLMCISFRYLHCKGHWMNSL